MDGANPLEQPLSAGAATAAAAGSVWRVINTLMLFVLGLAWGLQFTLIKVASDAQIGELGILLVSLCLLSTLCVVLLAWQGAWFRPTLRHLRFFFLSGLFGYVLPLGAIVIAAGYLTAGLIALFEALTPVFTIALALLFRAERVTTVRFLAVLLGAVSLIIVGVQHLRSADADGLNVLWIIAIVPLAYAIDGIYVARYWPRDLCTTQVVTGEALVGALTVLPLFLCASEPWPFSVGWSQGHWALAGFTLAGVLEAFLYFRLLKTAGAVYVSMASFLALFAGIAWGMLLLGEVHGMSTWLAAVLLCGALLLIASDTATADRA
jgi:drug/metabolite transporter (DMT)-like permease